MVLKLFKLDLSPPSRACMMACELFHVPVHMIDVNLLESEQKKEEFLKVRNLPYFLMYYLSNMLSRIPRYFINNFAEHKE